MSSCKGSKAELFDQRGKNSASLLAADFWSSVGDALSGFGDDVGNAAEGIWKGIPYTRCGGVTRCDGVVVCGRVPLIPTLVLTLILVAVVADAVSKINLDCGYCCGPGKCNENGKGNLGNGKYKNIQQCCRKKGLEKSDYSDTCTKSSDKTTPLP